MNWASQLSPHHRLIFPLRVPASPLRCLLFHRDEMRHYWLIRRDKENYLMHIQKINRNKAWYDTLKGKLFPQHIIKWDSADFFFHICFHFWLMFPDNLQHKYTTDNILRWQMHDNLCYLFHLCIHPAVFFMHFNSIQISNNKKKKKIQKHEKSNTLLRQWQHVTILTLVYDIFLRLSRLYAPFYKH